MRRVILVIGVLAVLSIALVPASGAQIDAGVEDKAKKAVDRAHKFLRENQNEDGSWNDPSGEPHPGITAMALVALLDSHRGYNDEDGPFIRKPVDYLIGLQKESGGIYKSELANYVTCVSLMALVRAHAVFTDDERKARIAMAIDKAKGYMINLQSDEGEGYTPEDKFYGGVGYGGDLRPDLSNTQMAMQALSEAGVAEDHPFFQKALKFVERTQNRSESNDQDWAGNDGGFVYYPGKTYAGEESRPDGSTGLRSYGSMTYAGLKSFIYAGLTKEDPRVRAAYEWITHHYTLEENPNMGNQGLYYYYHTFAKTFEVLDLDEVEDAEGGVHNWRDDLATKLVEAQSTDEGETFGTWVNAEDRWWEGDRTLCTIYAVMALNEILK